MSNQGDNHDSIANHDDTEEHQLIMRGLRIQRENLFSQVRRLKTALENVEFSRVATLKLRIDKVTMTYEKFDEIQTQIEQLCIDGEEDIATVRQDFESLYFQTVGEAIDLINDLKLQETPSSTTGQQLAIKGEGNPINVRLPPLQLPIFDGDFKVWMIFKDAFEANIDKNRSLTNIQKLQYLRGQLQGNALQLIQNLETTDSSYETAWSLLKKTYEDKHHLINLHLKAIFDIDPIVKSTYENLRELVDSLNAHIRSLEQLQSKVDTWGNMILVHVILSKLDFLTRRDWERSQEASTNHVEVIKFEEILDFIGKRCKTLMREQNEKCTSRIVKQKGDQPRKFSLTSTIGSCFICKGNHKIYFCEQFLKLSPEAKKIKAQSLQLCLNCLGKGHFARMCKASKCKKCGSSHNTLLHLGKDPPVEDSTSDSIDKQLESTEEVTRSSLISHGSSRKNVYILLATAAVLVKDAYGRFQRCRALIDPGSQASYVTDSLVKRLRLKCHAISEGISGIDSARIQVSAETSVCIKSVITNYSTSLDCLVLPSITQNLPQFPLEMKRFKIPHNIQLADPEFGIPGEIDMLLGADISWSLLINDQMKQDRDHPILQNTQLGWLISGPMNFPGSSHKHSFLTLSLERQVRQFWETEELPEKTVTQENELCEEHFIRTVRREQDGRFVVRLPVRSPVALGESYGIAKRRFNSLEKRLNADVQLKKSYVGFMNEYAELNHMRLKSGPETKFSYFLPHHPVIKQDSLTTKLRVVFDASAATTNGSSLNDNLLVGPVIQSDIFTILVRFRIHHFVMTADIEKMYRQINVDVSDQAFQQILWREDVDSILSTYQLSTVTYGTSCAPFLATRCLLQLAIEDGEDYPLAKHVLLKDFYMDDVLTGCHSREEAIPLYNQLMQLLEQGKFSLRKWRSNDSLIRDTCKISSPNDNLHILQSQEVVKTLGLKWDSEKDVFLFEINVEETETEAKLTKRSILSAIARIFDPLGLLGPIIATAKIILQRVWDRTLHWDDEVPPDLAQQWGKLHEYMRIMETIQVPRNINIGNQSRQIILHSFSDASPQAYGASLYAVSWNANGKPFSQLICSKSRVAPKKDVSLPRLELNAAVLATKLIYKVKQALESRIAEYNSWTDSTIVLAWQASRCNVLKPYVANRVREIQRHPYLHWRHVPSEMNPADQLTRVAARQKLSDCSLWCCGPDWLPFPDNWPEQPIGKNVELPISEFKSDAITLSSTMVSLPVLKRFSSFSKLRRVIAYCIRWLISFRTKKSYSGPLEVREFQKAEMTILRMVQYECLFEEITAITLQKEIKRKSPVANLNVFLDEQNILRLSSRLQNAQASYCYKNPIILPVHHVTTLILNSLHERLRHCGTDQLINEIRQTYYPLFGRVRFKRISKSCIKCFKMKPKSYQQLMGTSIESAVQMAALATNETAFLEEMEQRVPTSVAD